VAHPDIRLTGVERSFDSDEIIVSKTDTKGIITYANRTFLKVASYAENELVGQSHNIIRHPEMPRCIFKYLWDTISIGKEVFAYVINLAKNGDHYWVYAHVTPSFGENGKVIGYHSSRRVPKAGPLAEIKKLYPVLLAEEQRHSSPKEGLDTSMKMVLSLLNKKGVDYDQFIHCL